MCCLLILAAAVTLHIDTTHPVNFFDPREALGAGIDGHEHGQVEKMLRPENVRQMLGVGFTPLAYRLRTELAGEAWHWNPKGRWSDPRRRQGYWISDDAPGVRISYGYRLPRRGNTFDQANNDGYSRLDDGDPGTFWKSNPYLDRHFTGEDNTAHRAWVVMDFGAPVEIDMVRVLWGEPYATRFSIEYTGRDEIDPTQPDIWKPCSGAANISGTGGGQILRIEPVRTRYLRLLMTAFSATAPAGSSDTRDGLGVAIREIYAARNGIELLHHSPDHEQTTMYVSSTDPWHRASDRDRQIEQPGFDLIYRSGLTNGLPLLLALPVLYDVPENSASAVAYLKRQGYRAEYAELGEEPEEQYVMPEDYAALYIQWSRALHKIDPKLKTGGTSMVLPEGDPPQPSWLRRLTSWFLDHAGAERPGFFSFEWYPFDDVCAQVAPQLLRAPELLERTIDGIRRDGVNPDLPLFITEYGYSAYGSEAEVDLPGALLNADAVGQFLTLGGSRAYLYGYEPNELINEKGCSWGNNMLFGLGAHGAIAYRAATFWGARLLTGQWASPYGGAHEVYRVESPSPLVSAYCVRRPDGLTAVLVIHKDPSISAAIAIPQIGGTADVFIYSREQFRWLAAGDDGRPERDLPPVHRTIDEGGKIEMPPYSLAVIRGRLH